MASDCVFINRHLLNRLLTAGELLAHALDNVADDLDMSSGINSARPERQLPRVWFDQSMVIKRIINEPAGRLS